MRNKSKDENKQYLQGLWNKMEAEKNDHNIEIVKEVIDLEIKEKNDVREGLLEIKGRLAIYEKTSEKSNQVVKNLVVSYIPFIISVIALFMNLSDVVEIQKGGEIVALILIVAIYILVTIVPMIPFSNPKIFLKWREYTKIYIDDRLKEFEQETINHEHQNQVGGGEKTLNHGYQIKKEPAETADSHR